MQVFVHVSVFESIVGGLLGGINRGIEVLELRGEAHTHFEGVSHRGGVGSGLLKEACRHDVAFVGGAESALRDAEWFPYCLTIETISSVLPQSIDRTHRENFRNLSGA